MVPWVSVRVASNVGGEAGIADAQRAVEVADSQPVIGRELADVVGQIADRTRTNNSAPKADKLAAELRPRKRIRTTSGRPSTRVDQQDVLMKSSGWSKFLKTSDCGRCRRTADGRGRRRRRCRARPAPAAAARMRGGGSSSCWNQRYSLSPCNTIRVSTAQAARPIWNSYRAWKTCGATRPTSRPPSAPPGRDHEIEMREVAGMRFEPGQFAMAHHTAGEEAHARRAAP